ncbi:hypothetical protein AC626_01015, partial [Pseudoalteromonas rubra]
KIYDVMRDNDISYQDAIETDAGRDALLELLLHRHWIGFHAESLRIVSAEEKKISGLGSLSLYRDEIEKKVGKQAMDKLLDQFSHETESYFSELIKKM